MARPKTVKHGQKLNLYVPRTIKQRLFAMATSRSKSISAIVTEMVLKEINAEKPAAA